MTYKELETAFNSIHDTQPQCTHANSKVSHDGQGVVNMQCLDCGFYGIANMTTAIYLGWVKPEHVTHIH